MWPFPRFGWQLLQESAYWCHITPGTVQGYTNYMAGCLPGRQSFYVRPFISFQSNSSFFEFSRPVLHFVALLLRIIESVRLCPLSGNFNVPLGIHTSNILTYQDALHCPEPRVSQGTKKGVTQMDRRLGFLAARVYPSYRSLRQAVLG